MGTETPVMRFLQCGLSNALNPRADESAPAARKALTRRHNRWMHHDKKTCKCAVCKQIRGELVSTWYKHDKLSCKCAVCRQTRGESTAQKKQSEPCEGGDATAREKNLLPTGLGSNSPLRRPLLPSHLVREFSLATDHPSLVGLPSHVLQAFPMRADALRQPIWDFEFTGRVTTGLGQACWKGIAANDLLGSSCNDLVLPSRPRARSLDRESTTANNNLTTGLPIEQPIAAGSGQRGDSGHDARDEEITQPRNEKRDSMHAELHQSPLSLDSCKKTVQEHFTICREKHGPAAVCLSLATNEGHEEAGDSLVQKKLEWTSVTNPVRSNNLQRLQSLNSSTDMAFLPHDRAAAKELHAAGNAAENQLQVPPENGRTNLASETLIYSTTLANKPTNPSWCTPYAVLPSQNFLSSTRAKKRKAEIAAQKRAERQVIRKDRSTLNFRSSDACGCIHCMIQMRRRREEERRDASCKLNKRTPSCRCFSVCGLVAAEGESRFPSLPTLETLATDEDRSKANANAESLGLSVLPRKAGLKYVPEMSSKVCAVLESPRGSRSSEHTRKIVVEQISARTLPENRRCSQDDGEHVSDNVGWFAHDRVKCTCLLCVKLRKREEEQRKICEINARRNPLAKSQPKSPTSLESDQDRDMNGVDGHRQKGDDGEADRSSSANV